MTPTHDDGQLDSQIKDLLGRAVAEAPQPPDLEHPMLMKSNISEPNKRNPWIIGGGLGLSAAAALAAFAIIPGLGDVESVQTPATDPIAEVVVPVTTAPLVVEPAPDATDTDPAVTPDPVETGGADIAPGTDATADPIVDPVPDGNPDEATPPVADPVDSTPVDSTPVVVTTGADGVMVGNDVVFSEPALLAVRSNDGRVWIDSSDTVDDGRLDVFDPRSGTTTSFEVPVPDGHNMALRDVATVQGQLTVLYTTAFQSCTSMFDELCTATMQTFQPDTGVATLVNERQTWESAWDATQLADNGLIVGNDSSSAATGVFFFNISSGVTPTIEALGVEAFYSDCDVCPGLFTIDRSGAYVAFVEGAVEVQQIVIVELATGQRVSADIDAVQLGRFSDQVEIADISIDDGTLESGTAVLSSRALGSGQAPITIDLTTGASATLAVDTVATLS